MSTHVVVHMHPHLTYTHSHECGTVALRTVMSSSLVSAPYGDLVSEQNTELRIRSLD